MMNSTKRLCLWSGPRNISTALMYSFAQRPDTQVYDEPLYGYYLKKTAAKDYHPGAEKVMQAMECDGNAVVKMMMDKHDHEVVFFKNMCHHLLDLDRAFMQQTCNLILTRHPAQVITSFAKEIPSPSLLDIGIQTQAILLNQLLENKADVIVIDSNELLKAPKEYLAFLCGQIGIPFYNEMLHWEMGPKEFDGNWAPHWYSNVHRSTGFQPFEEKSLKVPEYLNSLLNEALPYFEQLQKHIIQL